MLRWLAGFVGLSALAFVAVSAASKKMPHTAFMQLVGLQPEDSGRGADNTAVEKSAVPNGPENGVAVDPGKGQPITAGMKIEPVIINGAIVAVIEFQEVPSERDGQLLFVARELTQGDSHYREVIRSLLSDPRMSKDPELRRITLSVNGFVEEKMTYLASRLQELEMKTYGELQDNLNFHFPNDLKHTYRRWVEDQSPPPLLADTVLVYTQVEQMKKLQVGDKVEKGQLLALIKPDLAVADLDVKVSKLRAAEADYLASAATRDEFEQRTENYKRHPDGSSKEDIRGAELQYARYTQEAIQKRAVIGQAKSELKAALTTVHLHDVRAGISGVVRIIYKNPGDAVFHLEPVLRIENPDRVRVEGQAELQEGRKLQLGMPVVVEATRADSPMVVLRDHMQEIHGVAVCEGRPGLPDAFRRPVIVSGSEDKKLCGWSQNGVKQWEVKYSAGVRSVACTPPGAAHRFVAAGTADGAVRLLDLDGIEDKAVLGRFCKAVLGFSTHEVSLAVSDNSVILADEGINADAKRAHKSAVTCVAFSPDGKLVATGGEDYTIALWDVSSGKLVTRLENAHKQSVSSLQIVKAQNDEGQPVLRMLSTGRDNVLTLWTLNDGKAPTRDRDFDKRSGDVGQLSSDGKRFLFDQGRDLLLLSLTNGQLVGRLQNPPAEGSFTNLALFSTDGQTILTNGTGDTGLQLWRAPEAGGRGSEVRQFMWTHGHATCAAFSPDGSFAVTGTREDHQVLVWKMPSKEEVQTPLFGKVSLVEKSLEPGSKLVRVWADLDSKPEWLLPGTKARMVINPTAP